MVPIWVTVTRFSGGIASAYNASIAGRMARVFEKYITRGPL